MVQLRRRWGTVLLALLVAYVLLLVIAPAGQGQTSDDSEAQLPSETSANSEHDETPSPSSLLQKAQRDGSVRVIVRVGTDDHFVPEGRLDRTEVSLQRDQIDSAQAGLQEDLQGTSYHTLRRYETIPYIALEVSPQARQALQRSSLATGIVEDRL